jgi:CBS domain-containing protein
MTKVIISKTAKYRNRFRMDLSLPVSTIMTAEVECVSPDQKLLDLKHIYEKQNFHSHIPVTDNGRLVGMISLIDFMRAISYSSLDDNEAVYHEKSVADIMSIHPVSSSVNSSIKQIAEMLAKGDFHSIVLTENDQVKGIVTTTDLVRLMLK